MSFPVGSFEELTECRCGAFLDDPGSRCRKACVVEASRSVGYLAKKMTETTHPSYPNPTIQEAVCEFQFTNEPAVNWTPSKPGTLVDKLRSNYPDFETISEQGVQFVLGEGGPAPQMLPPRLKLKFKHASYPLVLQFAQNSFAINAIRPYKGWLSLREEISNVWPIFMGIIKSAAISRVGMRYINRIERRSRDELPGHWFKKSRYLPDAVLESGPKFMSRLEQRLTSSGRLIVTLAHDETNAAEHFGSILFDIDRIEEKQLDTHESTMRVLVEELHNDIWAVFRSSKNASLEALLRGAVKR